MRIKDVITQHEFRVAITKENLQCYVGNVRVKLPINAHTRQPLLIGSYDVAVAVGSRPHLNDLFSRHRSAAEGVTRSRSLKKPLNTPTAIKKNSHCLQLIYQVVSDQ